MLAYCTFGMPAFLKNPFVTLKIKEHPKWEMGGGGEGGAKKKGVGRRSQTSCFYNSNKWRKGEKDGEKSQFSSLNQVFFLLCVKFCNHLLSVPKFQEEK